MLGMEINGGGLGAPIVHGQGLGAPIVHGQGLGVPITPIHGFGYKRWMGYESLSDCTGGGCGGVSESDLEAMAVKIAADPMPMPGAIAELMMGMSKTERTTFEAKLVAAGVRPDVVAAARRQVIWNQFKAKPVSKFWLIAGTVSMAASAYHGYKRNDSIGWALGWGFLGGLFPIITPTIALAQGFAKPKGSRLRGLGRNDSERELWVHNDEGLYNWWKGSRQSMRNFLRENRTEIDESIDRVLNRPPRR